MRNNDWMTYETTDARTKYGQLKNKKKNKNKKKKSLKKVRAVGGRGRGGLAGNVGSTSMQRHDDVEATLY